MSADPTRPLEGLDSQLSGLWRQKNPDKGIIPFDAKKGNSMLDPISYMQRKIAQSQVGLAATERERNAAWEWLETHRDDENEPLDTEGKQV